MGYLALAIALHTLAWFAAEAWFASGYGLPFGRALGRRRWRAKALVAVLAAQAWRGRHKNRLARHQFWPPGLASRGWRRRKERMRMTSAMEDIATVLLRARRFGDLSVGRKR